MPLTNITQLESYNLNSASSYSFANANISGNILVSGKTDLGHINNVKINGGANGYVLATDGTGNLRWSLPTISNSNGNVTASTFISVADEFLGDGVTTSFLLATESSGVEYTIVSIGGVIQPRSSYTISGSTLTFNSAPPNQALIGVTILGGIGEAVGTATTVTSNAQPNITTVGTLTSLTVSGNVTANNFLGKSTTAGTVTTNAQPNITSVGTLANLVVSGNITTSGTFTGNGSGISNVISATNVLASSQPNITSLGTLTGLSIAGDLSVTGSIMSSSFTEPIQVITNAVGSTPHYFNQAATFIHLSPVANFTANFTGVPVTNNRIIVMSLLIYQGPIAYMPNGVQVNGTNYTIKWASGVAPSGGSSNKIDVVSFTLVRYNDTWDVFGQFTTYGVN